MNRNRERSEFILFNFALNNMCQIKEGVCEFEVSV